MQQLGLWVCLRIGIVYSVNIGKNNQYICIHHSRYSSRQGIIITNLYLGNGNSIIFIDNWQNIIFQHGQNSITAIDILIMIGKVLLGQQNLPHYLTIFRKEFVIKMHQLYLAYCRQSLLLLRTVWPLGQTHPQHSHTNGTRGN